MSKRLLIVLLLMSGLMSGCLFGRDTGVALVVSTTVITETPATETEPAKKVTTIKEARYERSAWVDQQIEGASFTQQVDGTINFTLTGQQSQSTALVKAVDAVVSTNEMLKETIKKVP
ncbi:MAG: hypothetical protein RBT11_19020 [Desulfobacterales bacterium]|nr:hypothetical protein [Desulfobacterales bacterium]